MGCGSTSTSLNMLKYFTPKLRPGPNFTALLTVSEESALAVAENSVLTVGVFHGLARNFGFCACVFCVTKDSVLIA